MRFPPFALLIWCVAAPLSARDTVGKFATWAAFCDKPTQCFAISAPAERLGRPWISVAVAGPSVLIQAHLGRPTRAATLLIGGLRFYLTVAGEEARADPRTSRRIVAAIRAGETLTIVGTSPRGGRFRHHYLLAGAPSAIDAATVAAASHGS